MIRKKLKWGGGEEKGIEPPPEAPISELKCRTGQLFRKVGVQNRLQIEFHVVLYLVVTAPI